MSGPSDEETKEQAPVGSDPQDEMEIEHQGEEKGNVEKKEDYQMPSAQQEEEMIKKKYGGLIPKKKPLISKDHEHAFFDSADWALGKQGAQKPKGPLEALRPKLQPTPHHQARSRRSAYAPTDDEDGSNGPADHHDSTEEDGKSDNAVSTD